MNKWQPKPGSKYRPKFSKKRTDNDQKQDRKSSYKRPPTKPKNEVVAVKKTVKLKTGEGMEQAVQFGHDVKKNLLNRLKEKSIAQDARFYGEDTQVEFIRINRYLAKCGLGSRRDVEQFITEGKVKINDVVETNLTRKISIHSDVVKFENSPIVLREDNIILAFNKPVGYLCSHMDLHHEKTVFNLLPPVYKKLNMAGRLDITSRGLMIFASDGNLIQALSHPSHRLRKKYMLKITNCPEERFLRELFFRGIQDQGELLRAVEVEILDKDKGIVMVALEEGKKRQLHRMFQSAGSKILDLQRVQIGKLKLESLNLEEGKTIEIKREDIFY